MLSIDLRERVVRRVKEGLVFSRVAEFFETTRRTVSKWFYRSENGEELKDKCRRPHRIRKKVKKIHEKAIGTLRETFNWRTERLCRALAKLQEYMRNLLNELGIEINPIKLPLSRFSSLL